MLQPGVKAPKHLGHICFTRGGPYPLGFDFAQAERRWGFGALYKQPFRLSEVEAHVPIPNEKAAARITPDDGPSYTPQ